MNAKAQWRELLVLAGCVVGNRLKVWTEAMALVKAGDIAGARERIKAVFPSDRIALEKMIQKRELALNANRMQFKEER